MPKRQARPWCRMCDGQGFLSEYDRDWTEAERTMLFRDQRTIICSACGGDGRPADEVWFNGAIWPAIPFILGMVGFLVWMAVGR